MRDVVLVVKKVIHSHVESIHRLQDETRCVLLTQVNFVYEQQKPPVAGTTNLTSICKVGAYVQNDDGGIRHGCRSEHRVGRQRRCGCGVHVLKKQERRKKEMKINVVVVFLNKKNIPKTGMWINPGKSRD